MKQIKSDQTKPLLIPRVSNSVCEHEFIAREYTSQPYGTCMVCGKTIFAN
jgi:hypothetical protein